MIRYVKGVYSMNVNGGIVVEIQSGLGLEIFLPVNSPIYRYGEGESRHHDGSICSRILQAI